MIKLQHTSKSGRVMNMDLPDNMSEEDLIKGFKSFLQGAGLASKKAAKAPSAPAEKPISKRRRSAKEDEKPSSEGSQDSKHEE